MEAMQASKQSPRCSCGGRADRRARRAARRGRDGDPSGQCLGPGRAVESRGCWLPERRAAEVSAEENKDLIRRYLEAIDANESADWTVLDEYIAEDFVAHNPPIPGVTLDRDGMKQAAEIFRVATPGDHEIKMQVAEGDLVVSHIVGRGVHKGDLLGIPGTNREVETNGIAIHRVRDGKIVEYWSVTDVARVLQQVGALPGPAA
jgi:predicted ester cyclase